MSKKIFISHAHSDEPLARALKTLFQKLFEDKIHVDYSSDHGGDGGIPFGERWLDWILEAVVSADLTLVVLTPESVGKPWLMWEAGAVSGVALARSEGEPTKAKIGALVYRLSMEQIPSPLQALQSAYGEEKRGMLRLIQRINALVGTSIPGAVLEAGAQQFMSPYLEAVQAALSSRPMLLTEAAVQEWLGRLRDLRHQKRSAEAGHIHRALELAHIRTDDDELPPPLDLRIHRLLGQMYLESKQPDAAAKEFGLARQLSQRDIFIIHQQGLAELERTNLAEARRFLKDIEDIDPELTRSNAEIAGFAGRLYRTQWESSRSKDDLRRARDAYKVVMDAEASRNKGFPSYYMADNVGQLSLLLNTDEDRAVARDAFEKVRQAIDASGETSGWAHASYASALIATGETEAGMKRLARIKDAPGVEPRHLDSIEKGLTRLSDALGSSSDTFAGWVAALRG